MSPEELTATVSFLEEVTVRRLLVEAASSHPSIARSISKELFNKKLKETREQINLNIFTSCAQDSISRGLELKPSKQFRMAHEVVGDIEVAIISIEEKVAAHSYFATKVGALTALCEVGQLVVNAEEEIGQTLRACFREHACLEHSMEGIIGCMTDAERARLHTRQAGVELGESVEALMAKGNEWGIFSALESIHRKYLAQPVTPSP